MFKIGDKVELINNAGMSASIGETARIVGLSRLDSNKWIDIVWDNTILQMNGHYSATQFEIINYKNNMNILTSTIKRLFNKNKQIQYRAGFIDNCGTMTQLGREEFDAILQDAHEDEFTATAIEKIKEEKENK